MTGRARSAIRRLIRTNEREEFIRLGRATLEQTFARAGKSLGEVSLRSVFERFAVDSEGALFEAIQRGGVNPTEVLQVLFPGLKPEEMAAVTARRRIEDGKSARLYVQGAALTPGVSLHFAECCSPVPGDRIVGIGQPNKGLAVHTIDCPRLAEYEDQEELWHDLHWTSEAERSTISRARLTATIRDAPGVLGLVCTAIGDAGGNIVNMRMHHRQQDFFDVDFDIDVRDARHLTNIAAALRASPSVEEVERAQG